ncbi:MAG: hypothetical protein QM791_11085 [Ferruginibacter sp.]
MNIQQSLLSKIPVIRENTVIIDSAEKLQLTSIAEGVVIIYTSWSGPAITNCIEAVALLYKRDYPGRIIIIDADIMASLFQLEQFGEVCNGWGEIFVMNNGSVVNKYSGKSGLSKFKKE